MELEAFRPGLTGLGGGVEGEARVSKYGVHPSSTA